MLSAGLAAAHRAGVNVSLTSGLVPKHSSVHSCGHTSIYIMYCILCTWNVCNCFNIHSRLYIIYIYMKKYIIKYSKYLFLLKNASGQNPIEKKLDVVLDVEHVLQENSDATIHTSLEHQQGSVAFPRCSRSPATAWLRMDQFPGTEGLPMKIMNEPDVDAVFASRLVGKNHVANYEKCSRADATSTRSFDNPKHSYNNNIIISLITIDALSQCWPCYSEWLTSRPWRQISSWTFHGLHRRFSIHGFTAGHGCEATKVMQRLFNRDPYNGLLKSIYSI